MAELPEDAKLSPCPLCGVRLYACTIGDGWRFAHEMNGCANSRVFVRYEQGRIAWNDLTATAARRGGYIAT